ncbi:glycerate kinase [Hyperolius riggenbachi]|uniref:glycerate kinase n=1 Tax=Hyperolius riggenbachi TaxID=752182 RepID=UPI0035A35C30
MARIFRVVSSHRILLQYRGAVRNMATLQDDGHQIFRSAVSAVLPPQMLQRALAVRESAGSAVLECGGKKYPLHNNLYLAGFGKAVLGMAAATERIVGKHLVQGVISIPQGMQKSLMQAGKRDMLLSSDSRIRVMEGAANNMPDEAALKAAGEIRKLAEKLQEKDVLLVLISGGGSALLPAPVPPLTLQDKQKITKQLALGGATIQELNTIRRALSQLKGGGLARAAYPAQVVSLILSDVIGDDLDVIASGPTVPGVHNAEDCVHILSKYNLRDSISRVAEEVILSRKEPQAQNCFTHVHNNLIGSNFIALQEAECESRKLGYLPLLLSTAISGDVKPVSKFFALLAQVICSTLTSAPEQIQQEQEILDLASTMNIPSLNLKERLQEVKATRNVDAICVLFGGETTVQVQGKGKGGRNQELALRVAAEWHRSQAAMSGCDVLFLSGGTDGQDGPTKAAGASSYPLLMSHALDSGLDVEGSLIDSDSNSFFRHFQNGQHLVMTGLTGTNVMDVQALLIRKQRGSDPSV